MTKTKSKPTSRYCLIFVNKMGELVVWYRLYESRSKASKELTRIAIDDDLVADIVTVDITPPPAAVRAMRKAGK